MLVRRSVKYAGWLKDILPFCKAEETTFVYSMYRGYVEKGWSGFSKESADFIQPLVNNSTPCLEPDSRYDYNHTSGHASMDSLREICELIKPKTAIIPIHKEASSNYHSLGLSPEMDQLIVDENSVLDDISIVFDD